MSGGILPRPRPGPWSEPSSHGGQRGFVPNSLGPARWPVFRAAVSKPVDIPPRAVPSVAAQAGAVPPTYREVVARAVADAVVEELDWETILK
jgi:hypothetical protein